MKTAKVIARRQLGDGRRLVQIVCPQCGRHWLPADTTPATCPRRPGTFTFSERATT
jgi:uncharacterized OB-fold protein